MIILAVGYHFVPGIGAFTTGTSLVGLASVMVFDCHFQDCASASGVSGDVSCWFWLQHHNCGCVEYTFVLLR